MWLCIKTSYSTLRLCHGTTSLLRPRHQSGGIKRRCCPSVCLSHAPSSETAHFRPMVTTEHIVHNRTPSRNQQSAWLYGNQKQPKHTIEAEKLTSTNKQHRSTKGKMRVEKNKQEFKIQEYWKTKTTNSDHWRMRHELLKTQMHKYTDRSKQDLVRLMYIYEATDLHCGFVSITFNRPYLLRFAIYISKHKF